MPVPSLRMPKEMLSLASHILDTKSGHFDPAGSKDEFEPQPAALEGLGERRHFPVAAFRGGPL